VLPAIGVGVVEGRRVAVPGVGLHCELQRLLARRKRAFEFQLSVLGPFGQAEIDAVVSAYQAPPGLRDLATDLTLVANLQIAPDE
jgi:hypothetical protein